MIPTWWTFLLLAAAAYRLWRLLAEDTILDGPRARLLGVPGWRPEEGQSLPRNARVELAKFITCPWCAGFWISVAVWGLWLAFPHATTVAAVPWALSAVVGLVAKHLE